MSASTTRRIVTRRRAVLTTFLGLVLLLVARSAPSQAADPTATAIEQGLQSFATATSGFATPQASDSADHLSYLGSKVPLSGLNPLASNGLSINNLLQQALDASGSALDSPSALATALNSRDTTLANGVHVTLGCGDGTAGCGHPVTITASGGGYDITIPLSATRTSAVPLSLSADAADLNGGQVSVALGLTSTLSAHFDPTNADTTQRFALTTPPALHLTAGLSTPVALSFPVDLGFTKITVSSPASSTPVATLGLDVTFASPHPAGTAQAGSITEYDLTNTALPDYVTVARSGSVNATLGLDSDLTAASPDTSVTVSDSSLANGFQPQFSATGTGAGAASSSLTSALGSLNLADFTHVTPTQVLAGLGQLAASVQSLQTAADIHLPMLQNGVSSTLKLVDDLVAAVAQQTVVCGSVDGSTPSGPLYGLAADTPIYCIATTTDTVNAGSVSWSAVGGTADAVSGTTDDHTIGVAPTARAQFKVHTAGIPPVIKASYTTGSPAVTKGVAQPVPTAQDLLNLITANAGFSTTAIGTHLPTGVKYDPATHTLVFHLLKTLGSPTVSHGRVDFGDRLKSSTGLFGVSSAVDGSGNPTSTVDLSTSQPVLDLSFGVILVNDINDITPHSSPASFLDRFFVQFDPTQPVLSIDDVTATVTTHLVGQIGPVQVTAEPPASGTNFSLTKKTASAPILKLDLIDHPSGGGSDPAEPMSFTIGGSTVDHALPIGVLLPNLSKHVSLTPNFTVAGGVDVSAKIGSTTLGSGKVTFNWPVDSMTELTSASAFTASGDTDFNSSLSKFWEMAKDNPQALLQLILDQLSDLASKAATAQDSGGILDTQLPLVGVTPRQSLKQFQRLKEAVEELKGGAPAANVQCVDTSAGNGSVDSAPAGHVIGCYAEETETGSLAKWSAFTKTTPISGTNATDAASVGHNVAEAHWFTFTVPAGVTGLATVANPSGFRVHVDFDNTAGHHTSDAPALSSPPTLQALVAALTSKLGLPSDALVATIADLKKPGSGTAVKTLKLALAYDVCTASNTYLPACPTSGPGTTVPELKVPVSQNLAALGVPISTQGTIKVELNGHAQLDLGFPLDVTNSLPVPEVLGSSKASVQAAVNGADLGFTASLGPLSLQIGNTAPAPDGTANGGTGKAILGGKFSLARSSAADDQGYTVSDFIGNLSGSFGNTADGISGEQSCGDFDKDYTDDATDPDPTPKHALKGVVCANFSLGLNGTYLGQLGLEWTSFDAAPMPYYPDDLPAKLASAIFDPDFLFKALPGLLTQLQQTLANANGSVKLPVVGDALDAGADVVGKLNTNLVTPFVNGIDTLLAGKDSPKAIHDNVQKLVFDKLNAAGLMLDTNGTDGVTQDDVVFTITCRTGATVVGNCNGSTATGDLAYIDDASFDFQIGQGLGDDPTTNIKACEGDSPASSCATPTNLPFDIGLDGLPLRVSGALSPHVGWRMRLHFGMSRNDGPYLVVNHSTDDLKVGAGVGLGDAASSCNAADQAFLGGSSPDAEFAKYAGHNRCLQGTLGFLQVNVHDADGSDNAKHKRTGIDLTAGVKLTSSAGGPDTKLTLANITSIGAAFDIEASAQVNVFVRAGITGAGPGFPSVGGTFHVGFDWGAGSSLGDRSFGTTPPEFDNLYIDVGALLKNFLQPIVSQVQSVTSPLKPIIDTLQAPIPVVSQLAELVGQPPVTLIDLAEAASGSDLSVIKSIIDLIQFINGFNFDAGGGLIPLGTNGGSFKLDPTKVDSPQPSDAASPSIVTAAHASDISSSVNGANNAPADPPTDGRPSTFGVPGLDIPWIKDPSKVFNLLMGKDITLVDYQFGGLHAQASFSYTFGPFLVGPVPVSIVIGGSVGINGHLGIGYDTTGLREVIDGGGPEKLLDGLFFDTYDSSGHEAPVVQLIGTVTAGAEVDLVIVKAGIEAGLQLTVNFFWDDPTPDGKMGLKDIAGRLDNPICLFKVSGSLDAFIKAFVEIDLFFFSDRFEFTILQLHLLDFSAACSPPSPEPATLDGTVLKVNIGPRAQYRNFHYDPAKVNDANDDQNKEDVVVRALPSSSKHLVSVAMFGFYKEYGDSSHPISEVQADGGIGNDKITFAPGSRVDGTIADPQPGDAGHVRPCTAANPCNDVPFTRKAVVWGGGGDDVIVGGDAGDDLNGDGGANADPAGSDKISGGAGNDTIQGGPGGTDNLNGDTGSDHVYGGTWDGTTFTSGTGPVVIEGGPGGDFLYGSNAGDNIDGGPGLDPSAPDPMHPGQSFGQTQPTAIDGADVIVGSKGTDSLTGGPGDDTISGDEDLSSDSGCTAHGDAPDNTDAAHHQTSNDDVIDAGAGDDHVWGGSGNDAVKGGDGSNFLCGNDGDDTMEGNAANASTSAHSTIVGGDGQDLLSSGPGDSLIIGSDGNDKTTPGAGNDIVIGGLGRDYVSGGAGDDIELGDDGTIDGKSPAQLAALDPTQLESFISTLHGLTLAQRAAKVVDTGGSDTGAVLGCPAAYDQLNVATGNSDCMTGADGGDVMFAGAGKDTASGDDGADWVDGGSGDDVLRGVQQDDWMYGQAGADQMYGDSGSDHMFGGPDVDTMHGGTQVDYIQGNGSGDTIYGDSGDDQILGGSSTAGAEDKNSPSGDTVFGGEGNDVVVGDNGTIDPGTGAVTVFDNNTATPTDSYNDDSVFGNEGTDRLYGGGGVDTVHGNELDDYIEGNSGADKLFGDDGADHILGGSSATPSSSVDTGDAIRGGNGDDVIIGDNGTINADGTTAMAVTPAGTFGDDTVYGDAGYDQVYGQLGGDTVYGDAGPDYIVGDLGAITAGSSPATWPGGSPHDDVALIAPESGGADKLYGGGADDHVYAGPGDDLVQGNSGSDYLEGNNGKDSMYGLDDGTDAGDLTPAADALAASPLLEGDEDDMLGGSSAVNPESDKLDVGETVMQGNLGTDVMIGDNGEIARTPATATTWATDPITGGPARTVTLLYADRASCSSGVCGGDTMEGDESNDRIYGEGGNDLIHGNDGYDYVEGNQNDDTASATPTQYGDALFGDAGEDDLIGGSSQTITCAVSATAPCGEPDAGDTIHGGGDADVAAGDNAQLVKVLAGQSGDPLTNRAGMTFQRTISLRDLGDFPTAGTSGRDRIFGDDGVDVLFGQGGEDRIDGDNGDDYAEGGPARDWVQGDAGDDDLVGGSRALFNGVEASNPVNTQGQLDAGDVVTGGAGDDLITGDNAVLLRTGTPSPYVFRVGGSGALETQRSLRLLDLASGGSYLTAPSRIVSGGDQLSGGSGVDVIFGQDGDDQVSGGAGDDYAEGNGGHDAIWGDRTLAEVGIVPAQPVPNWPGPITADTGDVSVLNGQDDLIGGSSLQGFRDLGDDVHGDGGADYVLGDNGVVVRDILDANKTAVTTVAGAAGAALPLTNRVYTLRYPTVLPLGAAVVRHGTTATTPTRFCTATAGQATCEVANAFGADNLWGDSGDDTVYGQDGNDHVYGDTGSEAKADPGSPTPVNDGGLLQTPGVDSSNDDDLYGELGNDSLWGESGKDAMLGDRGGIRDVYQNGGNHFFQSVTQVPKVEYDGFSAGTVTRVVDQLHDVNGDAFLSATLPHDGIGDGGDDRMRGGTDADAMHGEKGDDLMNGDSGGDALFGDDGADVMWGGKGCDQTVDTPASAPLCYPGGTFDPAPHNAAGETLPLYTDYLNGGKGGTSAASIAAASGSDILDWHPRLTFADCTTNTWPTDVTSGKGKSAVTTTEDPCAWFQMTNLDNASDADNQHHQGVDWQYGGWDRDVLQGDVADNGPNEGDRLLDWNGTYNLYTHCNSAYGGYNDVRQHSPSWQAFLQKWVWGQGAGQSLADASTSGTSAFDELALVYPGSDNDHGSGSAYPSTPGHFDNPNACAP